MRIGVINTKYSVQSFSYRYKNNDEVIREQYRKIEDSIGKIIVNDDLPANLNTLSELTGISVPALSARFHSANGEKISNYWKYAKEYKRPSSDKEKLSEFYGVSKPKKRSITKDKSREVIDLLYDAISTHRQISYNEIQRATGLNRDEIDYIIEKHIQNRERSRMLEQKAKKEQQEWYESHKHTHDIYAHRFDEDEIF